MIIGLMLLVLSPFFFEFSLSSRNLLLLLIIVAVDMVANYFYFKTFEKTEVGVAVPLLSLAPAFTFFFSWLFIGEIVSLWTYVISSLMIILIFEFSVDFKHFKKFSAYTLLPALTSSILFGVSAIPTKLLLTSVDTVNAPTVFMLRALLIGVIAVIFFGLPYKSLSARDYKNISLRSLFVIAQWILLYVALTIGTAGESVTLANITPVFVFIMGIIFLREKFTIKKCITAVLVLILSFLL